MSSFQLKAKQVMDKLTYWQSAAGQMKTYLPLADAVLAHWYRLLQSFKKELPTLHKLTHEAIKVIYLLINIITNIIRNNNSRRYKYIRYINI